MRASSSGCWFQTSWEMFKVLPKPHASHKPPPS